MSEFKINLTDRRRILVQLFYRYALTNSDISVIKQDLLDETQEKLDILTFEIANKVADQIFEIIDVIVPVLSIKWQWERIPAYVQSALIIGTYEIKNTDTPKPVTINEILKLIKFAMPDYEYKYVNAVLDKMYKPNG
ncbi:transcription antitermination protein NusB [Entomoplasma ellychniae]|uniref:Transcription antitermination protein NusB n=1 Tax=Entomoplasma ellychniae TaxID=2114 RepID=A0A8E2UCN0_9MOLU|nr:transcription antitermination protein NusB [Entomoplasma ellychniae]PPE04562.1 transcription antitermination protein NusB [Entomoplasma ellychniae]